MQDQLLSILDMADSQRSGSLKETGIDIRILVATDTDLAARAKAGSFRKDLYDRLKLFELTIPPLRERKDDIHPLCRYFFDKYRQELGKSVDSISPEVVKILVDYDFPGNVRELEHIIERAVILVDGNTIERKHLPVRFLEDLKSAGPLEPRQFSTLAELEKRYIVEVLEASNGNKSKTAEISGHQSRRAVAKVETAQGRTARPMIFSTGSLPLASETIFQIDQTTPLNSNELLTMQVQRHVW